MVFLLPSRHADAPLLKRRDLLRVTGAGASALCVARLIQAEDTARHSTTTVRGRNYIYIFLCGRPSQLDLWNLKPDAPDGIRSPFSSLQTHIERIHFTQPLPLSAQHAAKLAMIRSMSHGSSSHEIGIACPLLASKKPAPKRKFPPTREIHSAVGGTLDRLLPAYRGKPVAAIFQFPDSSFTHY